MVNIGRSPINPSTEFQRSSRRAVERYSSEQFLVLRMGSYYWTIMNKFTTGMNKWEGNGNITTLLFSPKWLEILHQGKRIQVKTMGIEHFNIILFHKSKSLLTNNIFIYHVLTSSFISMSCSWIWYNFIFVLIFFWGNETIW
jgi:hypothetical protein